MPNPGDTVNIITKKETVEGILMPSSDPNIVLLKLKTGYNIGFPKKDITKITTVEEKKEQTMQSKSKNTIYAKKTWQGKPTILILHTGGTIASKVDYRTGGVVANYSPTEIVKMFPELDSIADIQSELITQMWSDDLRFSHFSLIAEKIKEYLKSNDRISNKIGASKIKGIIIGMGTDNMTVAAAALSFIVEKSPVPIIFVASQRSSDRGSADAAMNLICAAEFITKTNFGGVAICMHEHSEDKNCVILPGTKTYKLHSSRRDAFKAVNDTPTARIGYQDRTITMLKKEYPKRADKLILKPKMEDKVGLLKIHINMFPEQFEFFKGYKGLIIEGTGMGHTPGQVPNSLCEIHKKIYPAIQKVIDSGCIVVMTTQCLFGSVNMNVYDKGRDLLKLGILPGKDMLANTAFVKLSWLLANYPKKEVEKLIIQNLRGEINERIEYQEQFI